MGKKTLSQELADFMKPQSFDFDIEDNERENINEDNQDDDNGATESEDEGLKKQHYIDVGKSSLRDNKIRITDAKYTGNFVSRKDMYGDEGNRKPFEEAENSGEEDEEEGEEDEEGSDSGADLSAESSDEEIEDESTANSSEDEFDMPHSGEVNEQKREKIKELMAKESTKSIQTLGAAQLDALKGYSVKQQQSLYDSILDSRIKFQKGLGVYNQLPQSKETIQKYQSDKTQKYLKKAESSLFSLLDSILDLRVALYKKDKIVNKDKTVNTKKRSFDSYVTESEGLDATLNSYRTAVLTKWSQKVQAASGSAALNASKFKSINQTAATQVENNLSNMDRLIKRTRLNRRNVKPLGYVPPQNEDSSDKKAAFDPSLQENENIFDDEDFYRLLLRDLIDKKVNDSVSISEANIITLTKANKLKKNVDTKASKGRKLNFKTQEPLQNYMAPRFDKNKWDDYQIDEFFAGLLGQKVNMDEDEEIQEPEDEQSEALVNDDIQIFA